MVFLIQLLDGVAEKEFPIDKPLLRIGRNPDNDICIDDKAVSKKHAVIEVAEDPDQKDSKVYYIKDIGSINSTYVNGIKIKRKRLKNNDLVRIGLNMFKFFDEDISKADQTMRIPENWISEISDKETNNKGDAYKLHNEKIDGLKQIYSILNEAIKLVQEITNIIESEWYFNHKISIDDINKVEKILGSLSHYYASNKFWLNKPINDKMNDILTGLKTIHQNMALCENKELKEINAEFKEDWRNLLNYLYKDFEILIKSFEKDLMIEIPFLIQ